MQRFRIKTDQLVLTKNTVNDTFTIKEHNTDPTREGLLVNMKHDSVQEEQEDGKFSE